MPDERGWGVKLGNSLGRAPLEGARLERGRARMGCERGNRLRGALLEGARRECRTSAWGVPLEGERPECRTTGMECEALGGAPLEGARPECRTSVDGVCSVEIAWGELRRKERDGSAGRAWMGCETWK